MKAGKFIVFEGIDGVGKTTQVSLLMSEFQRRGIPVETYPEPGGTLLGSKIRELLLHSNIEMCSRAQVMLFMASRADLMHLIGSRLAQGITVILDRWSYSTFAYQQELSLTEWEDLTDFVSPGCWPDVCFWMNASTEERKKRLKGKSLDRFEKTAEEYQDEVVRRYGVLRSARPEIAYIDAMQTAEKIHEQVKHAIFQGEF